MTRKRPSHSSIVTPATAKTVRGDDDGSMTDMRARHARMLAELDEIGRELAKAAGRQAPAGERTAAHAARIVPKFGYSPENMKLYLVLRREMESRIRQRRLLLGPAASSLIH